ncbi:MAG: C-GCAxxG-C-C family protein [Lachnospiraceae bacterium]|nr:C-GCAxxG-C-C family protein [Lachnospiraceae bacterium]
MTIEERANKGAALKGQGICNCTRAVLAAFEDLMEVDRDALTRLTAGFAAGMGNMEATCGALIGAVMVAGVITGGKGTPRQAKAIQEKFKELSGALVCKDLKGVGTGCVLCECPMCVKNAVLAVGEVLNIQ